MRRPQTSFIFQTIEFARSRCRATRVEATTGAQGCNGCRTVCEYSSHASSCREERMRRSGLIGLGLGLAVASAMAKDPEPIVLRDMGSFHIGGRQVDISGKPARQVPLPGGQTQKVDLNGTYVVEQMYVQYVLP